MPTVPIDWASMNCRAGRIRFFLDLDWRDFVQARFLQRCVVSPIVCGSLCVLDLLPARVASANIGQCSKV